MTSWMNSLINQQDGCLQMVARQASQGRLQQEHLASVAQNVPIPCMNKDQGQYLRAQLAHGDAQLEHVRSERETHFAQEKQCLHICVYSVAKLKTGNPEWSAKQNKSCVGNPQKQHNEPLKCKNPWTDNFKHDGDKQKQNSGICTSPTTLKGRPSQQPRERVNWNSLQLEARTLLRSQDLEHEELGIAEEREREL